jgi:hypothetical protein
MRLSYATHSGFFVWPALQLAYVGPHPWANDQPEYQVCLWWLRGGVLLRWVVDE